MIYSLDTKQKSVISQHIRTRIIFTNYIDITINKAYAICIN